MLRKLLTLLCGIGALAGCTGKNPLLDSTPPPPQANTIQVSVYDGTVLQPGVSVYVRYPSGSVESAPTDSNGVAALSTSGTGTYAVGFSGQSAQTNAEKQVVIVGGQTLYSVSLQLKGAAMAVQIPFGQSNGYAFASTSKAWTLTYFNSSDFAADVSLSLATTTPLPAGWSLSLSQSFLTAGQSVLVQLTIPQGSDAGNKTLRIEGRKANGSLVVFGDLFVSQEWSISVRATGSIGVVNSGGFCPVTGLIFGYQGISLTVDAVGIPYPAVFSVTNLQASLASTCTNNGTFTPVWNAPYMGYSNTINGILLPSQAMVNVNFCSGASVGGGFAFDLEYGTWSKTFTYVIASRSFGGGMSCGTTPFSFNLVQ